MQLGDWVQAAEEISEEDFNGQVFWIHAAPGGVGHVISLEEDPDWVNVYWERTETTTICHVGQLARLGDADTGRLPEQREH